MTLPEGFSTEAPIPAPTAAPSPAPMGMNPRPDSVHVGWRARGSAARADRIGDECPSSYPDDEPTSPVGSAWSIEMQLTKVITGDTFDEMFAAREQDRSHPQPATIEPYARPRRHS